MSVTNQTFQSNNGNGFLSGSNTPSAPALATTTVPANATSSVEVSEVITRVPQWATRGLLYLIVILLVVAVMWANLSKIDIVAEARGNIVPQGNLKRVQSGGSGRIQTIFVKEGDSVERGQPIVQLDAEELRIRVRKLREELQTDELQLRQSMVSRPMTETLEQRNRCTRLQSEIAEAERFLRHTTITAPSAGTVTSVEVRSPGDVVQASQTVATIAPGDVPLVLETELPNRDISSIEKGRAAKLKFDAFPFQDYGVMDGIVIDVSPDAHLDQNGNSFYTVTIAPLNSLVTRKGKKVLLRPGLSGSAEIITDRKSVWNLLLQPFRKFEAEGK